MGFKLYAMTIYYYFEIFGELRTPNIAGFLAADGPYLVSIILVLSRLLFCSHPFGHHSSTKAKSA
jgi:hypothetical protein